jgi:hypothetical protein
VANNEATQPSNKGPPEMSPEGHQTGQGTLANHGQDVIINYSNIGNHRNRQGYFIGLNIFI